MAVRSIFIGDPHFQISNMEDTTKFMSEMHKFATDYDPDIIIIAGDLLHTHERLHTLVMNKACEFISDMARIAPTYILVGNHDYISNTQFLTTNHWMNFIKSWDNVTIVDTVRQITINECNFIFVPYVFPGRFEEALSTIGADLSVCNCVFAHQEFRGCKMGAIASEIGDLWDSSYPLVISGHIHQKQWINGNVYYPGTPMQHSFGESGDKSISCVEFNTDKTYNIRESNLDVPKKKIVYVSIADIETLNIDKHTTGDNKVKITVKGNSEEFKALKKTNLYKELLAKQGVAVSFKHDESIAPVCDNPIGPSGGNELSFEEILKELVRCERNPYLSKIYQGIVYDNHIQTRDIFFL